MKILIIDNNIDRDCWGSSDLRRMVRAAWVSTSYVSYVRRAPQDDLPKDLSSFDRIIVSGSKTSVLEEAPWIERLIEFIKKAIELRKPYLGICYGHQLLVRAVSDKTTLAKAKNPEIGWTKI